MKFAVRYLICLVIVILAINAAQYGGPLFYEFIAYLEKVTGGYFYKGLIICVTAFFMTVLAFGLEIHVESRKPKPPKKG